MSACANCTHRQQYHFRSEGECAFVNDEQDTCRCQHYVAPVSEFATGGLVGPGEWPAIEHPAPFVIRRCPTCGHEPAPIDGDRAVLLLRIVRTWQDRQTVAEQMFAEVINRAHFDGKDVGRREAIDDLIEYLREIR